MTNVNSPRPTESARQVVLDSIDDMYRQLVDRLDGLTDSEYRWEPAAEVWTVRSTPDGAMVDFDGDRDLEPAPLTTIAWRLWHLGEDCFSAYAHRFRHGVEAPLVLA